MKKCRHTHILRLPHHQKQKVHGNYSHSSLNDGIRSERCVVRRFHHCANFTECACTYTNL